MTLGKQYLVGDFSLLGGGRKAKGGGGGREGGSQRSRKRAVGGGGKGNKEVYSAKHVRIQQKKKEKAAG